MFRSILSWRTGLLTLAILGAFNIPTRAQTSFCPELAPFFKPPKELSGIGKYSDLLKFDDGRPVRTKEDWTHRRQEIKATWERMMGSWPPLVTNRALRTLETTNRENFV